MRAEFQAQTETVTVFGYSPRHFFLFFFFFFFFLKCFLIDFFIALLRFLRPLRLDLFTAFFVDESPEGLVRFFQSFLALLTDQLADILSGFLRFFLAPVLKSP